MTSKGRRRTRSPEERGLKAPVRWTPVFVLFLSGLALAQVPIDPLRRPEEEPGQYTWRVGLGYTPSGLEGFAVNALGHPYTYTLFSQEWQLTLAGTIHFGGGWKAGLEISESTMTVDEIRRYPWGEERLSTRERKVAYALLQEWRMDPKNPWDPRVSLMFGYPWKAGVTATASLLRDPMVLVGEIGLRSQEEEPQAWLTLALGAGFVANAWISLSTSMSLAVPVIGVGVPATTLGLRLRYALDPRGKTEVGVRVTLSLRGNRTWLGLAVEAAGRRP